MKPTAYFVNNARSRMVRYDDLYEVLKEGRIAGAVNELLEQTASDRQAHCFGC